MPTYIKVLYIIVAFVAFFGLAFVVVIYADWIEQALKTKQILKKGGAYGRNFKD